MKLNKMPLKWKIFGLILIFSILVVLVFCFFQIFMLESFYKKNKINAVEDLLVEVEEVYKRNLSQDEQSELLSDIASSSETAIYIISKNGDLLSTNGDGLSLHYFKDLDMVRDILNKAGNLSKFYVSFEGDINVPNKFGGYPLVNSKSITSSDKAIICCKSIMYQGQSCYVVLDARLSPVAPAVTTLKLQLLYISVIVLGLSIVCAIIISNIISKPIKKINDSATLLASGVRDVDFRGDGFKEITELNKTLNYAVAELNKTDNLKKEILANITHDLKTPLTLISGYAQMMQEIPSTVTSDNLQIIIDEVERLNTLVNDLVDLSKLQAKTVKFEFVNYNFTESVKTIIKRINAFSKDFSIKFSHEQDVFIMASETRISQVIYNFIINAINYSKNSKEIEINQIVEGSNCRFEVVDYGVGISESNINIIWDRYERLDKNHQRSVDGSGLGLSICKEILIAHNYEYGVISKEGKGSCFYFCFPISK